MANLLSCGMAQIPMNIVQDSYGICYNSIFLETSLLFLDVTQYRLDLDSVMECW